MTELITANAFARMPDIESALDELDEGRLVMEPFLKFRGAGCFSEIMFTLSNHIKRHGLGKIYGRIGFRLNKYTVRAPNTSFIRQERLIHTDGYYPGAPDLAVEIFESGRSVRNLKRKVKQYFEAGTNTVWIVYPESREVNVLEASGADRVLGVGEMLDFTELLPGFSVKIDEFFE